MRAVLAALCAALSVALYVQHERHESALEHSLRPVCPVPQVGPVFPMPQ